ncbi:MAG: GtrA family protein, partial [Pseudomonadota bacterium]
AASMSLARLTLLYGAFAVVATLSNLGAQWGVHQILPPDPGSPGLAYWGALGFGTGVGLVVKYLLDKRWIFFDTSSGVAAHSKKFSLYTLMGVATTVIFWGMQTGFFMLWGTESMLYLGGALGLAIGYVVKYNLDRRFVFDRPPSQESRAA